MRSFLVPCAVLVLATSAAADTLKVPADFDTISDAAAVAADGDVIAVSKGTYLESVTITAPNVKLVGKKAVIDAQFGGVGIQVNADGVSIAGFTVVNGSSGIVSSNTDITITKCIVATCNGDGISLGSGEVSITSNVVTDCGGDGIDYVHSVPGHALIDKNVCSRNNNNGIIVDGIDMAITRNRCEQNENDGIDVSVSILVLDGGPVSAPILIEKNVCIANEDQGIQVFNDIGTDVVIHDNDCSGNCDDGLVVDSPKADIQGNHCDDNMDEGLDLRIDNSVVSGNTASGNQGAGMFISGTPPVAEGGPGIATGNENTISKNTCNDNTADGIHLDFGSGNTFSGNKCSGNGDDGMDIQSDECNGNAVDGNNFSNNGHEGLDNSGTATDVTKNTCKGNGYGVGPDIAGKGDNNAGSVDAFQDNKFGTGGESSSSRLDNFANTTP